MMAAFVLWGGLGRLDAADAARAAGMIRLPDIVAGGGLLLAAVSWRRRVLRKPVLQAAIVLSLLLVGGILIGWINGNRLLNILFEARLIGYMLAGLLVMSDWSAADIDGAARLYATVMAGATLIQFGFLLAGDVGMFLSNTHTGNAFTLWIPFTRPPAFHLIGVALVLSMTRRGRSKLGLSTWLLAGALLVNQSRTYWVVAASVGLGALALGWMRRRARVLPLLFAAVIGVGLLMIAPVPSQMGRQSIGALVIQKFALLLEERDIASEVIGARLEENRLMLQAATESPAGLLIGKGLGYIYRDLDLLFARTDERERERLAMYGHNTYAWLLLKFGLIGFLMFAGVCARVLAFARTGGGDASRFGLALAALLIPSLTLGSLESPTGAFLFGLLIAGVVAGARENLSFQP